MGRSGVGHRTSRRVAAVANRARATSDFRCDTERERQAPRGANRVAESGARRRLDQDRFAGDHRRCDPIRQPRGGSHRRIEDGLPHDRGLYRAATVDVGRRTQHRDGDRRAARIATVRRTLGVRAGGRRHHPGGIRPAATLSRGNCRCRAGGKDRGLSPAYPGRARGLGPVPRRRLRHEREREGLFRAEDDRRPHRRPAHGSCARGNTLARWRIRLERVHASDAGFVRLRYLARGARDAGRDHAAPEVVSIPSRQDFLLEPHRHRAVTGAADAQATGAQSERGEDRRALSQSAAYRWCCAEGAAPEGRVVLVLSRRRCRVACNRAAFSAAITQTRDRARGGMGRRAPQR